ncbi:MAG: hypothetical protein R6X14_09540 [bacterium]
MRVQAIALADETRRLHRGFPPKGAWLFLTPNLDISRLAPLATGDGDDLEYLDLRTTLAETVCPDDAQRGEPPDLVLVHTDFGQEEPARELEGRLAGRKLPRLFFGPLVTAWGDDAPGWLPARVLGDIINAWPEVRRDATAGRLRPCYRASTSPTYVPPQRPFGQWPETNATARTTSFIVGCHCRPPVDRWCRNRLYYGSERRQRACDEVIAELLTSPGKQVTLLDDDVAAEPDYYAEMFQRVAHCHQQWVVRASPELFDHPRFIRLLAKSGVRLVFLNEPFLDGQLEPAVADKRRLQQLRRRVKTLQSARMLVGARVLIRLDPAQPPDFEPLAQALQHIDLDLVEPRCMVPDGTGDWRPWSFGYRPMLTSREPGWLSNRFYSMAAILDRAARRPRRTGFYTTARYLLPYSLAYRQDSLEGLQAN